MNAAVFTEIGNGRVRVVLIEGVWTYRRCGTSNDRPSVLSLQAVVVAFKARLSAWDAQLPSAVPIVQHPQRGEQP